MSSKRCCQRLFFFGVRMTPEVFDSVKAAFDTLNHKLKGSGS